MSPEKRTVIEVDGRQLTVSNLDKVLYPDAAFTKADVIWYYLHVAPVLLPHLQGRPLTMTRYPDGVGHKSFFEKHSARRAPEWARRAHVPKSGQAEGAELIEQVVVDDLATLVWVANLAALELHVPQWRSVSDGSYGRVDLIVFDLDPGAPATIVECCVVADWLRSELESRGLVALPKTSGSKGLQLYARLDPPWPWEQAYGEAREIARLIEREHPDQVLSNMRRELRGGQGAHRLEPEPRRQDDDRAVFAPGAPGAERLDAAHMGRGATGRGRWARAASFSRAGGLGADRSVGDLLAPLTEPRPATAHRSRPSAQKGPGPTSKRKT